ncbi:MAG: ABC transporter substrate-binding protein [Nitriliruptoraceae bacterium]|nr:ABC transporter substrate-binding protein [Nitriliruptoraceae bacterium]
MKHGARTARRSMLTTTALALLLAACGADTAATEDAQHDGDDAAAATSDDEADADDAVDDDEADADDASADPAEDVERSFTDAEGVTVSFDEPIERVVCLTGPCVDILAELDVEPAGILGPRLVTDERYFGVAGEQIPVLEGSFDDPDLESLAAMEPDLVIGLTGFQSQNRDRYETVAPFVALGVPTLEAAYDNLLGIGALLDRSDAAQDAIDETERLIDALRADAPGDARVLHMVGFGTDFTVSVAGALYGSVLDEVFDYPWDAPVNPDDPTGLVPFSLEEVLEQDPEWLFVADLDAGFGGDPWTDQFEDNPIWNELTAVQQGQVELVDTGPWINYRGTRAVRLVLDEAVGIVYPEVFAEAQG